MAAMLRKRRMNVAEQKPIRHLLLLTILTGPDFMNFATPNVADRTDSENVTMKSESKRTGATQG